MLIQTTTTLTVLLVGATRSRSIVSSHGARNAGAFTRTTETTRCQKAGKALGVWSELWLLNLAGSTVLASSTELGYELVDLNIHSLLKTKRFVMPLWDFTVVDKQ